MPGTVSMQILPHRIRTTWISQAPGVGGQWGSSAAQGQRRQTFGVDPVGVDVVVELAVESLVDGAVDELLDLDDAVAAGPGAHC